MNRNRWIGGGFWLLVWAAGLLGLGVGVGPRAAGKGEGEWPQFRGPNGSAVSEETGVPVRWGPDRNVRWKADLPGRGVSCPVVAGGRVYVTASSEYRDRRLHVLCFDEVTGKKLWERQLASTGNTLCHPKTCMAGPTPVTDGQYVYALFATGDLAALDRDGNLLWYRALARDYPDITNQVGMAASPVLCGDTLLLPLENAGDSFAAGLDRQTGQNRWRAARARDINWVTPLVIQLNGRQEALFQTGRDLTAYDPRTGQILWAFTGGETGNVPSPVAGQGLVFASGRQMLALRPATDGKGPEVVWRSSRIPSSYASPLYYRGRIYGVTNVGVSCLSADDGRLVWQQRVRGPFSASPIVAGGKLYAVNEEGTTTVIGLGDRPRVLGSNRLDETILATPAVAGGALFLRSDQHLWCIGK